MKHLLPLLLSFIVCASRAATPTDETPHIQVVFALDVTGSMNGLIHAAKDKIWTIASSLAQTEEQVIIELGLVAYRDRGDAFITKITDLTTDLDRVYRDLQALNAAGGGDTPEDVNQALNDAIHQCSWASGNQHMRTIFLIGDCAPHLDYPDQKSYNELCQEATQRDIVINTMLMGTNASARHHWQHIAQLAAGDFLETGMDANHVALDTPYDEAIKAASRELESNSVYVGKADERARAEVEQEARLKTLESTDAGAASRRAMYLQTDAGESMAPAATDLIDDLVDGSKTLEEIKVEELPDDLRGLSPEDREAALTERMQQRKTLVEELDTLLRTRQQFIIENNAPQVLEDSFSNRIFQSLNSQSKRKNIQMKETVKF